MATCTTASLAKRLEKLLAARAPSAAGPTVHDVARYRAYLEGKGPRPADVMRRYYLEPTAAGAKAAVEAARQVFTSTGRARVGSTPPGGPRSMPATPSTCGGSPPASSASGRPGPTRAPA